ncbi:ATP/GTP-binding protein [Paenibacillus sp. RRE4]|uniref:AAA family ATPase n=1 Tax=Paenibacillus sp. RRE4 TaxID=2962587 RepID=UPI002881AC7D|nr:ATP/GTP-binding protein [Paenibacillus sp. RRE4]MDT0124515.1 ATP/GTP-binding protein [Paenibacillus sp. RRE4]
MLVRFSVENFKSFFDRQELMMIPAKKIKLNKEHTVQFDKVSLLRTATIYGANASGKSNLIEAMKFAKYVITNKVPLQASKMYCRVVPEGMSRHSTFEFEILKNNKFYAYGFSINLYERKIISEWLYELIPDKDIQHMLFERETEVSRIELGSRVTLDEIDLMKFKTYTLDFEENNSELFLKEMNRNKKFKHGSSLEFFKDVFEWFDEDLVTIFPEEPFTNFEYFYGDDGIQKINKIIDFFDTGISKVKIEEISLSDMQSKLPKKLLEDLFANLKDKLENSENNKISMMSLRTKNAFYNIKAVPGDEPIITTIKLEHGEKSLSDFEFDEESDGTRRLFDLLDILISNEKNKVYVIDELERSLHPKLTYKFIELFFEILKENHTQLIFTTHESTIMDQNLLRRDEIWFVERNKNNISHLYSLDRFKERYDKKLSKAYLDGRYGAIPVLKGYSSKKEREQL